MGLWASHTVSLAKCLFKSFACVFLSFGPFVFCCWLVGWVCVCVYVCTHHSSGDDQVIPPKNLLWVLNTSYLLRIITVCIQLMYTTLVSCEMAPRSPALFFWYNWQDLHLVLCMSGWDLAFGVLRGLLSPTITPHGHQCVRILGAVNCRQVALAGHSQEGDDKVHSGVWSLFLPMQWTWPLRGPRESYQHRTSSRMSSWGAWQGVAVWTTSPPKQLFSNVFCIPL